MRYSMLVVFALLAICSGTGIAAGVSGSTENRIKQLAERAAKMAAGKTGEYAKDSLETAQASIQSAQMAAATGNETLAIQKIEQADLQLSVADSKASAKETAELVGVKRAELKKLEAQLERYRQGGE